MPQFDAATDAQDLLGQGGFRDERAARIRSLEDQIELLLSERLLDKKRIQDLEAAENAGCVHRFAESNGDDQDWSLFVASMHEHFSAMIQMVDISDSRLLERPNPRERQNAYVILLGFAQRVRNALSSRKATGLESLLSGRSRSESPMATSLHVGADIMESDAIQTKLNALHKKLQSLRTERDALRTKCKQMEALNSDMVQYLQTLNTRSLTERKNGPDLAAFSTGSRQLESSGQLRSQTDAFEDLISFCQSLQVMLQAKPSSVAVDRSAGQEFHPSASFPHEVGRLMSAVHSRVRFVLSELENQKKIGSNLQSICDDKDSDLNRLREELSKSNDVLLAKQDVGWQHILSHQEERLKHEKLRASKAVDKELEEVSHAACQCVVQIVTRLGLEPHPELQKAVSFGVGLHDPDQEYKQSENRKVPPRTAISALHGAVEPAVHQITTWASTLEELRREGDQAVRELGSVEERARRAEGVSEELRERLEQVQMEHRRELEREHRAAEEAVTRERQRNKRWDDSFGNLLAWVVREQLTAAMECEEKVQKLMQAYRMQKAAACAAAEALARLMDGAGRGLKALVAAEDGRRGEASTMGPRLKSVALAVVAARRLSMLRRQREEDVRPWWEEREGDEMLLEICTRAATVQPLEGGAERAGALGRAGFQVLLRALTARGSDPAHAVREVYSREGWTGAVMSEGWLVHQPLQWRSTTGEAARRLACTGRRSRVPGIDRCCWTAHELYALTAELVSRLHCQKDEVEGCRREATTLQRKMLHEAHRSETLQAELSQQQHLAQLLQGRVQVMETISENRVPPEELSRLQHRLAAAEAAKDLSEQRCRELTRLLEEKTISQPLRSSAVAATEVGALQLELEQERRRLAEEQRASARAHQYIRQQDLELREALRHQIPIRKPNQPQAPSAVHDLIGAHNAMAERREEERTRDACMHSEMPQELPGERGQDASHNVNSMVDRQHGRGHADQNRMAPSFAQTESATADEDAGSDDAMPSAAPPQPAPRNDMPAPELPDDALRIAQRQLADCRSTIAALTLARKALSAHSPPRLAASATPHRSVAPSPATAHPRPPVSRPGTVPSTPATLAASVASGIGGRGGGAGESCWPGEGEGSGPVAARDAWHNDDFPDGQGLGNGQVSGGNKSEVPYADLQASDAGSWRPATLAHSTASSRAGGRSPSTKALMEFIQQLDTQFSS